MNPLIVAVAIAFVLGLTDTAHANPVTGPPPWVVDKWIVLTLGLFGAMGLMIVVAYVVVRHSTSRTALVVALGAVPLTITVVWFVAGSPRHASGDLLPQQFGVPGRGDMRDLAMLIVLSTTSVIAIATYLFWSRRHRHRT